MDTEKVIKKLESKGVYGVCDKCEGQMILNEDKAQIIVEVADSQTNKFDSYIMFCNNCGHIDFYSAQHLD